jgi:hypothetical protein
LQNSQSSVTSFAQCGAFGGGTPLQVGGSSVLFSVVLLELFFRPHKAPGFESSSNMLPLRNADKLTTYKPDCLVILESQRSGNLGAFTAIAVPVGYGKRHAETSTYDRRDQNKDLFLSNYVGHLNVQCHGPSEWS